jgi:hypothetical protein
MDVFAVLWLSRKALVVVGLAPEPTIGAFVLILFALSLFVLSAGNRATFKGAVYQRTAGAKEKRGRLSLFRALRLIVLI